MRVKLMIEKSCNLWLERADYRCVLTNGAVTGDGEALLDYPSAREAADKYTGFAADLGRMLTARGNHVHLVRPGLCNFPIKQFQWSTPTLQVIERSAHELVALVGEAKTLLPRPGCGDGELAWEDVAKALSFLPDNIIIVG
ncbi:MAG: ADP-ribose-binding protein [Phycisphaerae bacterium]|nr:ADP-ribose-binding protein [Phycisphaerae bacterium]